MKKPETAKTKELLKVALKEILAGLEKPHLKCFGHPNMSDTCAQCSDNEECCKVYYATEKEREASE